MVKKDDDFWVAGRPFVWSINDLDEEEAEFDLGGWKATAAVSIAAMCNNPASHAFLAALAIRVASLVNGMILIGDLSTVTSNSVVLKMSGHIDHEDYGYFVTPSFLSYWLGERDFCLIK